MHKAQRLGRRGKHLEASAGVSARTGKISRQIFLRGFHDNIQKPRAFNLTASHSNN